MTDDVVKPVRPVAGLGRSGAALWRQIAKQWADDGLVPDARERRILADACREADILAPVDDAISTAIESGDLTVSGSMGQTVAHPLIGEARRSRQFIAANLKVLGFSAEGESALPAATSLSVAQAGRLGGIARHRNARG